MPIRPELRHFYQGPAWTEARARVLERAKNRCEQCGKPLRKWVFTYTWQTWRCSQFPFGREKVYHMIWVAEDGKLWRDQFGRVVSPDRRNGLRGLPRKIRVKLTVAHADFQTANMDDANLRCWCTWCHLHHDAPQHKETRSIRKDRQRPILQELIETAAGGPK